MVLLEYHPFTQEQAPGEESNSVLAAAHEVHPELPVDEHSVQSSWQLSHPDPVFTSPDVHIQSLMLGPSHASQLLSQIKLWF